MSESDRAASNKDNPARFVPLVVFTIAIFAVSIVFGSQFCAAERAKKLRATGQPATATIVELVDTGNRYNRNPEIKLTLEVVPKEGEAYRAIVYEVFDAIQLQTYVRGAKLDIRYDAEDPGEIAIVGILDESGAPPPPAPERKNPLDGLLPKR
ncbi:MAG: DUF3592 domain-containing protein [Myxococcota bacterium]